MTHDPYVLAAEAMVRLSRTLVEARAVQFTAPDRPVAERPEITGTKEISNPTLDIVLDQRRSDVSDEVVRADSLLRRVTAALTAADTNITRALVAYNGEEPTDD